MSKKDDVEVLFKKPYTSKINNIIKFKRNEKENHEKELRMYANNFLKTNFDMQLNIPIKIDGRLTRTGGSFHYMRKDNKPVVIKISERFMACALHDEEDGIGAILDVLEHELVHYALARQGKNFNDGDHDFESTLAKLKIGASGATNKKKVLSKSENIWYQIVDIYYNQVLDKFYTQNHTKKSKDWVGERLETQIIKTRF